MSNYEPLVVRRTTTGDVTRAVAPWFPALRFGPKTYPFDIVEGATLVGTPWGYDQVNMIVSVPPSVPSRGEMALVRGGFGYPTTPMDGEVVWYNADSMSTTGLVTQQINVEAHDTPLTQGRWYYYSLFVCVVDQPYPVPGEWLKAATGEVLVPRNYGHAAKLFSMLPPFYQRYDDQQAADGRFGSLRKFMATLGYDCDYNRTLLDGVLNVYHPDYAPLVFMEQVGANLGLAVEEELGGARYRSIIGQLWDLDAERGTAAGLEGFIYAATNYQCDVVDGHNTLLTPDDSEFINGVGHWQAYTNPHVVDLTNGADSSHPPLDPYLYLVLRSYAGTAIPLLPTESGQGVLEVIELVGIMFPGQPGYYTGPPTIPLPNSLAQLQSASPPIAAGTVANYYTDTTKPWWSGDYIVLGDGSHAYWTGSAWAAGQAPNTGLSVRPAPQYLIAGAPATAFPFSAQVANQAALPAPSPTTLQPPVAWKAGDYVLATDGTTWHPEYQTVGGHPSLVWVAGVSTLTIAATQGALGPISGYNPKWQVSDGSPAVAPATLATLRSTVPMITGRAQSNTPDRPWDSTQSFERLYTYDNTRVSWIGQFFGPPGGTGTYLTLKDYVPINTQRSPGGTGTAWVDAGAVPVGATATNKMLGSHIAGSGSSPGGTLTLPAGWNRVSWPADVFAPSGVAWTNPAGDGIGWQPASNVTLAEFNAFFLGAGTTTPVLAGTIMALFINGVEHSRSTADGTHPILAHLTNASVLAGQPCEIRIWCPSSQNFYTTTTPTYSYATYPFWRIAQAIAIPANSGVWKATVAGHFNISATLTPSTADYTNMQPVWIMKNRLTIASGYLNNDNGELCRMSVDTDIAVNDIVYVALQRNYVVSITQRLSNIAYSPGLVLARWEVV